MKKNIYIFFFCLFFCSVCIESNLHLMCFPIYVLLSFPHLQVAIIAGNFDLAEIIKVHKASDVGKSSVVAVCDQAPSVRDLNVNVVSRRHQTEGWLSVDSRESQGK